MSLYGMTFFLLSVWQSVRVSFFSLSLKALNSPSQISLSKAIGNRRVEVLNKKQKIKKILKNILFLTHFSRCNNYTDLLLFFTQYFLLYILFSSFENTLGIWGHLQWKHVSKFCAGVMRWRLYSCSTYFLTTNKYKR